MRSRSSAISASCLASIVFRRCCSIAHCFSWYACLLRASAAAASPRRVDAPLDGGAATVRDRASVAGVASRRSRPQRTPGVALGIETPALVVDGGDALAVHDLALEVGEEVRRGVHLEVAARGEDVERRSRHPANRHAHRERVVRLLPGVRGGDEPHRARTERRGAVRERAGNRPDPRGLGPTARSRAPKYPTRSTSLESSSRARCCAPAGAVLVVTEHPPRESTRFPESLQATTPPRRSPFDAARRP